MLKLIISSPPSVGEQLAAAFGVCWALASVVLIVCVLSGLLRLSFLTVRPTLLRRLILVSAIAEVLFAIPAAWFSQEADRALGAAIHQSTVETQEARRATVAARAQVAKLSQDIDGDAATEQSLTAQIQDLKQELGESDTAYTQLRKEVGASDIHPKQRHLSAIERRVLVESLKPFGGQKVQIFSVNGDDEGRVYRDELARTFEQAGWDHEGSHGVRQAEFDVDPVGLTLILHAVDAGHGHTNRAINTLIATLKRLNLFDGGGVYISDQVPDGWVKIAIGKKTLGRALETAGRSRDQ
jgi:hypothetical protein